MVSQTFVSPVVRTVRGVIRSGLRAVTAATATLTGRPVETEQAPAHAAEPVEMLPYPELTDPIPVVEQVLAAEAAQQRDASSSGGPVTEPHASSRDEEHGRVPLRRAEREAIADAEEERAD